MSPVDAPALPRFNEGSAYLILGKTLELICRNLEARTLLQGNLVLLSPAAAGTTVSVGNLIDKVSAATSPPPPPVDLGSGSEPHVPSGSGEESGSGSRQDSDSSKRSQSTSDSHSVSHSRSDSGSKAIVPVAGEWVGWFCEEQPQGTFEHVMVLHAGCCECKNANLADLGHACAPLPPEALQSVDVGSLVAVAADANGVPVCARVEGETVIVETDGPFRSAVVTIQGARRGHAVRWRRMSRDAAAAYESFYRRAVLK